MRKIWLFTDGSVNTKSKIGYGAYLAVTDHETPLEKLKSQVKIKRFESTSSTKLEIQTLLWAITENSVFTRKLVIYTDSQNIIGLPFRRAKLEQNSYYSKNNKPIKNHIEYKEFYKLIDLLDFDLIKLSGHKVSKQKDYIDILFSIVDRASRYALRNE